MIAAWQYYWNFLSSHQHTRRRKLYQVPSTNSDKLVADCRTDEVIFNLTSAVCCWCRWVVFVVKILKYPDNGELNLKCYWQFVKKLAIFASTGNYFRPCDSTRNFYRETFFDDRRTTCWTKQWRKIPTKYQKYQQIQTETVRRYRTDPEFNLFSA